MPAMRAVTSGCFSARASAASRPTRRWLVSRTTRCSTRVRKSCHTSCDVEKKLPAVAHMMRRPHQLPVLKLSEASAHVGARYREGFRDVLGSQRIHRKVQQCMNLRHSKVQAPSAAHFAPVKDELACHSRESHKRSFAYCYFGIYRNLQKKQRGWQREGRPLRRHESVGGRARERR
jgi:hypothetical protein